MNAELNFDLLLYVAGNSGKSMMAKLNLTKYCNEHLLGRHSLEIIDLLLHPHLATEMGIIAIPTLVKKSPEPVKKLIGDLSNKEKVLSIFGIKI
jgi:circadian clock protein KaiB